MLVIYNAYNNKTVGLIFCLGFLNLIFLVINFYHIL